MTDIQALNAIIVKLGGKTAYKYNIQAYNAWSVLQGGTGLYKRDIDALNAIDILNGGAGGHRFNIDALNSIDLANNGQGNHKSDISALVTIATLLNYNPEQDSDINLFASGRSGLTIPATVGDPVQILTPVYRGGGSNYILSTNGVHQRLMDGGDYTLYFKIKIIDALDATNQYPIKMGNNRGAQRGMCMLANSTGWYTYFSDGVVTAFEIAQTSTPNTTFKNAGWMDVFIQVNNTTKRIISNFYNSTTGAQIGTGINYNFSAWTMSDANNAAALRLDTNSSFGYADLKKFTGLKTLAQCKDNNYITDLQFYYPTIYDTTDVSGNANHLSWQRAGSRVVNKYFSDISTYALDKGYSLYRSLWKYQFWPTLDTYEDLYIPYDVNGNPIVRTINDGYPVAYIKIEDHAGSLTDHNLSDSMLTIPVAQWDKSSTTIYEDAVRSYVYYDAANTKKWHISELDYLLFSQRCKAGHKKSNFFKIIDDSLSERKILKQIFSVSVEKSDSDLTRLLQFTGDKAALDGAILLYLDGAVNNTNVPIEFKGITGTTSVQVYWGDGSKRALFTMDGSLQSPLHTYAGTAIYPIYIFKPENIIYTRQGSYGAFELAPANKDMGEFKKCINLEHFITIANHSSVAGDITVNGLTDIQVAAPNTISADVTQMTDLEILRIFGNNTFRGLITFLSKLKNCYVDGNNTIGGEVSSVNQPLLESFEGGFISSGLNTIYGSLNGMTHLHTVCFQGNGVITCNVETTPAMVYLSSNGNITWSGDISSMVNIWYLSVPGLTGSIAALVNLRHYYDRSLGITKQIRFNLHTKLDALRLIAQSYTSEETNQILADMWANKDAAKNAEDTYRLIQINGTPTGQGLIDKAALQAYRTPNNNVAYPLWTVITN